MVLLIETIEKQFVYRVDKRYFEISNSNLLEVLELQEEEFKKEVDMSLYQKRRSC